MNGDFTYDPTRTNMAKTICSIILFVSIVGCSVPGRPSEPQANPGAEETTSTPARAEPLPSAPIARPWLATGISFNGSLDPNFPKDAGIRMHLKDDGTYTMTGPGAQTQGAWKMETASELHLMDSSAGGVQRFAVDTLTNERLALRLMDEQNAVVVLLYKAE